MYRHRQVSYLFPVLFLVSASVVGALAWTQGPRWLLLITVLFVLVAALMSSLTIEVNDQVLTSYFGPGIARKTVRRSDIASVEASSSSALEGWGIRITTRGMLYNVTGSETVEIRLSSGERYRLGTDQQAALLHALRAPSEATGAPRQGATSL
ncbi:MAG TPA: hypothetical protein VF929_03240 [Gemmatimonadaceae bacterium]